MLTQPSSAGSAASVQAPATVLLPAPAVPAAGSAGKSAAGKCSAGSYVGTYMCDLQFVGLSAPALEGSVMFNLSSQQTRETCAPGSEFCADLVISKNSGTLFGEADPWGFITMLEGGLDCSTGTFRARGVGGHYGPLTAGDPALPSTPLSIDAVGDFDADLEGTHQAVGDKETITGMWKLSTPDMFITCTGAFELSL